LGPARSFFVFFFAGALFQFQIKNGLFFYCFLFGIGMGGRMPRRNAKHCERLWRNHAARRQIKIAGRNFYLESELKKGFSAADNNNVSPENGLPADPRKRLNKIGLAA
jgi:hypothetical protein